MSRFKVFYALAVMIFMSLSAHAVSDSYSDGGGGTYWCNVYVSSVSDGKSYGWCTGKDETAEMNNFRGFQSEHNGVMSLENPTIQVKFRYHYPQAKSYNKDGSTQDIYVKTRDGALHKIANWGRHAVSWTQTDYTWGVVGDVKLEDEWFSFRYAPNGQGVRDVVGIQIENETYYHQDNLFTDYYFQVHARYLKDVTMDFAECKAARVECLSLQKLEQIITLWGHFSVTLFVY